MDRSFLFQPQVIAASRSFVCVRLATYEDETEAVFLKAFTSTKSGELENSVFGILAPDGQQKLIRSGRGPKQAFAGPAEMAEAMKKIARLRLKDQVGRAREQIDALRRIGAAVQCDLFDFDATA